MKNIIIGLVLISFILIITTNTVDKSTKSEILVKTSEVTLLQYKVERNKFFIQHKTNIISRSQLDSLEEIAGIKTKIQLINICKD